jgi:dienelactone hydrolase
VEVPRDKLHLRDDKGLLSPPIITEPLYGCAKTVNITGYVPDATLDVEVNGAIVVNGFPGHSPAPYGATIHLPNPLVAGQKVRARQHHAGATSGWSPTVTVRDHTADYPAGPPRPELFPTPLYKCGVRTGVGNLLIGCDLRITANNANVGAVAGANNPQGVNVNPAYDTGQHARAWAELCNDPSPPSLEQIVQPPPLPLPAPGFDPIYEGGTQIVVNTIVDGARFTLSRNGVLVGTFPCWGGKCIVGLNPPFSAGETFSATQELCPSDGPSPPGTGTVQPCTALPAPQIGPVQDGDTQIVITQFVPGSEIKVFVNNVKTGDGSGPVVALTAPVPHSATVDVWQILGTCAGSTVQQVTTQCVAPPVVGDPSALDLFPVGTHEYDNGQVTFDGFTYHVRGSIYYPAEDDGVDKPFNTRLAKLGRVPLVVCVHGAHSPTTPSYHGYDYFQYELARMGFVAVSVDERETDLGPDWAGWTQNIVRRAELAIASIDFVQQLDANGPIFKGTIDFSRTGLMGHSRGGDCVIAVAERITLPGVNVRAVLSLAPVNSGANSGKPHGYAFMTFLPAADGDVVDNNGAQFYDQAVPAPFKTQLYIDHANHNYFNRQWLNDDTSGGLPIMARPDHERFLSTYGCAFFRRALRSDATFGYLDNTLLPSGVQIQNLHLSYDVSGARMVDNYEGHPITIDNEGQNTAQIGGLVAHDYPFAQTGGAFNPSFFGNTTGNVAIAQEAAGDFREPLAKLANLSHAEVRVRAAEVYQAPTIPPNPTGFRVGVEDNNGTIVWVDVNDVGGLPRPFGRRGFDLGRGSPDKTKTLLSTFRFPGRCFAASEKRLRISRIRAIHLGLNRGDGRPIAFDDVEIVKV